MFVEGGFAGVGLVVEDAVRLESFGAWRAARAH